MIKPITPDEVSVKKREAIPDEVIEVFNDLIAHAWNGNSATFTMDVAQTWITNKTGIPRSEVFNRHLMDIEDTFREAGWDVKFDSPAYCESYSAYWVFTRGK